MHIIRWIVRSSIVVLWLLGQAPITHAETIVGLSAARLQWTWTPGTGDTSTTFRIKCGTATGVYTITKDTGNVTTKTYPVASVLTNPGTYFCVVAAADAATGMESNTSNEVSFRAANLPASPSNLVVLGQ